MSSTAGCMGGRWAKKSPELWQQDFRRMVVTGILGPTEQCLEERALPLTSCETLSRLPNLSEPPHPPL